LRQAHLLWHQAAESYHEPERLLANVNTLIQELRNITFILQSEKARFRDFDSWYLPLQARLRANKNAKWLLDTRNLVVKQGALQGSSFATIKLLTWEEVDIARISVPEDLSSLSILNSKELQEMLPGIRARVAPDEDAVLIIQKSWSTAELNGREILEVLAEVYGSLADIVLSAHLCIGNLSCTPPYEHGHHKVHRDFPLLYDRSGWLRCMILHLAERNDSFRLSTLENLVPQTKVQAADVEPWQLLDRYGLDESELPQAFERMDPEAFAEKIVYMSKKLLRKDRTHGRFIWLRDGQGEWRQIEVIAANRAEKHLAMRHMGEVVREIGGDAFLEVGEVWTADVDRILAPLNPNPNLENYSGHGEALLVQIATRDGLERSYSTPFTRGPVGGIKFGETERLNAVRTNHIASIRKVWAEQRRLPQGSTARMQVWEPDALDPCPCGGDQPFGVCCMQQLKEIKQDDGTEVRKALQSGRAEEAERIARARVARYAIWVRQHTALSLNADRRFAKMLTPIDAHALEAEINLLETSASAAGHADSISFTYHRLQEILGVPALARRMVSLSARWLMRIGRIEEGLLELDALGEIRKCKEWLALTLAAQYGEYPDEVETELLEQAVEAALGLEERSHSLRNLACHHFQANRSKEALETISNLLSDHETDEEVARFMKAMRWRITQRDEDFEETLAVMKSSEDSNERLEYVSWLMDTEHLSQALEVLNPLLEKQSTMAMLLATECYIRKSEETSASNIFEKLAPSQLITPILTHGYAHVQALLVLGAGRQDLQLKAIRDIELILQDGSSESKILSTLLDALRAQVNPEPN
jgi:hypothetical protein